MQSKQRQFYKLFLIILLFGYGLFIAGVIFPTINLLYSSKNAKDKCDTLKIHWLKRFSNIMNLHITKEGELPKEATLIVSNHISWLDIIVLGQFVPAYFVAKNDILNWPIIGYLSKQGGTIFISRSNKKNIKATAEKMVWILKQNSHIIAFPEGTTTKGDEVLGFHASLFQPALLTQSPIQPVVLQYQGMAKLQAPFVGDDEFIPHLIKMLRLDKIEVQVSFLSAISSSRKNRLEASLETRDMIIEKFFESSPQLRASG